MNLDRVLIGSVVFLAVGLGLIFSYSHGTASFSAGYPVSGTSLQISITTTGMPALSGFASTVIGLALLIWAFVGSLLEQVPPSDASGALKG
jgi:hypothetical protein